MEWLTGKEKITEYIKKYRIVFVVLLLGIFLMILPTKETTEEKAKVEVFPSENPSELADLQEALSKLLSKLSGAGRVEVLLTISKGERITYQMDESLSSEDVHRETVLITNGSREESGLVIQTLPPEFRGAIVLCQGADNAKVHLSIVEAVKNVTGLTSDRITVLKMK